ncbi:hypothetical protein TNCV_1407121 [Trichonephila clavipes]|nr:hypothetical protein TNCV_1407121 [Trichonephila clavipes]
MALEYVLGYGLTEVISVLSDRRSVVQYPYNWRNVRYRRGIEVINKPKILTKTSVLHPLLTPSHENLKYKDTS